MNERTEPALRIDEDRMLKMSIRTVFAIISGVVLATIVVVSFKLDLMAHSKALDTIATAVANDHEAISKQETVLKLMDQKLDYLARGRKGEPPALTGTKPE